MEAYIPSKETNQFQALMEDIPDDANPLDDGCSTRGAVAEHLKKRLIYKNWSDLHPTTKRNLLKFENDGYRIPERASGEEHVLDLVSPTPTFPDGL